MSTKGYLPHSVIKGFVFWMLSICIVVATVAGILSSWGTIAEEIAHKCLWTAFMLATGSVAFLILNCLFGEIGHMLLGHNDTPPNVDPAFADRLKKAKVLSQAEVAAIGENKKAS